MNAIQFTAAVQNAFMQQFPNGWIVAKKYCIGGGIYFRAGLLPEENSNLGRMNDVLRMDFGIHDNFQYGTETEIDGKIVIEFQSSGLNTLPDNPYYAMGTAKIASRKINNTPENAVAALVKYFAKAREVVNTERDNNNIYGQANHDAKYFE